MVLTPYVLGPAGFKLSLEMEPRQTEIFQDKRPVWTGKISPKQFWYRNTRKISQKGSTSERAEWEKQGKPGKERQIPV